MECKYCKQEVVDISYKRHESKCKIRFEKYPIDNLILDYENGLSLPDLSKKYNFSVGSIYRVFNSIGYKTKTIKESCNGNKKEKYETTMVKKYGVKHNFKKGVLRKSWEDRLFLEEGIINVFQRDSVKLKSVETLFKNYGVNHPMQIENIKEKIKEGWFRKWGVEHPMMLPEIRKKIPTSHQYTKIHKKVVDFLRENDIDCETEYDIDGNCSFFYDIKIVGTNKLIEVNGDYWHCNPKFYKENDIIKFPGRGETLVSEVWVRDKLKENFAIKNNFSIFVVWSDDLNNNENYTLEKLLKYGKNKN
jgi:hypothetical protein